MSKILTSPVKKWPGTITLPDFLTIGQAMKWEEALSKSRDILPECEPFEKDKPLTENQAKRIDKQTTAEALNLILPGILACVESWNLEGLDPNKFPATPLLSRAILVSWIVDEITKLYNEENEVPNELSPTPSNG